MIEIFEFTIDKIDKIIEYEKKLRQEEPNIYFWEPNEEYNLTIFLFHLKSLNKKRLLNLVFQKTNKLY